MGKLKNWAEEQKTKKTEKPMGGSGSYVCHVPGCQNPGMVALGIAKADASTQWKCSFHAWGKSCHTGPDWRDILINKNLRGGKKDG